MSPEELAALWHLPHEGFGVPEIAWAPGRQLPASSETARIAEGVVLGENRYAGRKREIRLPYADRATHVYVVGKTGVGKSTLLHHVIRQDIAAGKGVGVIDPHGRLVRDILRSSIPPEREDDVVIVDLAQANYPPPLNPFAVPEGVPREVALNQVLVS
jgi:DNA helicase HerA-like ATPase